MPATLDDLHLVHVFWEGDEGLVSLRLNAVLCYAYNHRHFIVPQNDIPTATIFDADFDQEHSTWDEVPALLRAKPELIDRSPAGPAAADGLCPNSP